MVKKASESSRPGKLRRLRNASITLNEQAHAELMALEGHAVDLTDPADAPETVDWSAAQRGKFYRPVKQQITLRLDGDVLQWFKKQSGRYQALINEACREYMQQHDK